MRTRSLIAHDRDVLRPHGHPVRISLAESCRVVPRARQYHVAFVCLLLVASTTATSDSCQERDCDVLIRGGLVYDGTGSPPRRADVAIRGDVITYIGTGRDIRGARVIDAQNLAVAPGFINMLSWSTESLIADGRSESEIRQGVTTQVFGEGQSMGPLNSAMKRRRAAQQSVVSYPFDWNTLAEYLQWLERRGIAQNVASFVGAGTVREYVIGMANRPATALELEQMQRLVRDEMEAGALGVGSALVYPPGSYATTEELIALCKVATAHGGMYTSHIRNQADELIAAIDELIRIARAADIPAEIYHFGVAGEANWTKLDTALEHIESARRDGLRISANMHAYHAGCTGLTACLPPWCLEGGPDAMIRRLRDPVARRRVARDIERGLKGWDNPLRAAGSAERLMLVHFESPSLKKFEGKTLAQVAELRRQELVETIMDLIVEDRSRIETVYFVDSEENVRRQMRIPWISFGSDAASISLEGAFQGRGIHPRAFGNFARVLGKYVRDERLVSWEAAIHRMTGLPASNLRLERRGLLREGYFADIVLFNPETIADRATFEDPRHYATGIEHVFVNGTQVFANGKHTGALPGRALKRLAAAEPATGRVMGLRNLEPQQSEESFRSARETMVKESLEKAEPPIKNPRVLDAMRSTPRHQFVAAQYRKYAYVDTVLPIGYQQTISPPYIVAYMTECIDPQPSDRVLEIGTGSGYQAAVLSPLVQEVYSIEIVEPLGRKASEVLRRLAYSNVHTRIGDGYQGWPEKAPFDKIIVTCSPDHIPQPLVDQLKEGGLMIIPVGERYQQTFFRVHKQGGVLDKEKLHGTFFVPMTGEAERQRRDNPDGTNPAIINGGFELGVDVDGAPEHWYYQRGVTLQDENAPEGAHYALYANDQPGHLVHSNQGFAVDGRRVEYLDVAYWARTERLRTGPRPDQSGGIAITFFDRNRGLISTVRFGPPEGTSNWTELRERVPVPRSAQDAVVMIGLNGATGRIAFDDIRMVPALRQGK